MTVNLVGPESGNRPLGACFGGAMESTCSCGQPGESRDDGDSLFHFIFCGLRIFRYKLYCKISHDFKDKNGIILSASLGVISRVNVFI